MECRKGVRGLGFWWVISNVIERSCDLSWANFFKECTCGGYVVLSVGGKRYLLLGSQFGK